MSRRTERIAALIQSVLGELLQRKLKDPRLGFVTVTGVDLTPDLKLARVFYTVLEKEKEKESTQRALEHSAGFLQHEIAEELKLRFTPKLSFHFDVAFEEGMRIEKILGELHQEEKGNS